MRLIKSSVRALGSPCEIQLYAGDRGEGERVMALAVGELQRIETKYSRYRDDSIVSRINRSAGCKESVEVDPETALLLDYAATAWQESGGSFDITSGVLRRAWSFETREVPSERELERLCECVGFEQVRWRSPLVELPRSGMELDFGGFGKEYAADRVAALCREAGIRHGLVDLGGDLRVVGPHPDGRPWQVGIRDPRQPEQAIATLELSRGAIATSGDYERYVEIDGVRYCHLLDPVTGWPVRGLRAVSVVADCCLVAGTASTVAMLRGSLAPRWLGSLGLPHLWIDADGGRGGSLWPRPPERRGDRIAPAAAIR